MRVASGFFVASSSYWAASTRARWGALPESGLRLVRPTMAHHEGKDVKTFSVEEEARSWDKEAAEWSNNDAFSDMVAERMVAALGADAARLTVLDFGCGAGALAAKLAPHVDKVSAVDIAPKMVAEARKRLDAGDPTVAAKVDLRCMLLDEDTVRTPEWASRFDVVVTGSVLHCVPDAAATVRMLAGVTAPGGRAFHYIWELKKEGAGFELHEGATREYLMAVLCASGGDPGTARVEAFEAFGMTMLEGIVTFK